MMKKFLILATYFSSLLSFAPAIAQDALQPLNPPSTNVRLPEANSVPSDLQPSAGSQFLGEALPPTANFDQPVSPIAREMPLGENSGGLRTRPQNTISFTYMEKVPNSNTKGHEGHQAHFMNPKTVTLKIDADLASIDLPPDGKRIAVLTITARRHQGLVQALKDAKTDEEKTEAEAALRENYQEHYAVETWWRQQRLTALEEQLAELKAQVQTRTEAEEKYVDAAMTIAKLHVDGVSITPPVPAAPGGNALNQVDIRGSSPPNYAPFGSTPNRAVNGVSAPLEALPNRTLAPPTTRPFGSSLNRSKLSPRILPVNEQKNLDAASPSLSPNRLCGWDYDSNSELVFTLQLSAAQAKRMMHDRDGQHTYAMTTMPSELVGRVRKISLSIGEGELPRNPALTAFNSLASTGRNTASAKLASP